MIGVWKNCYTAATVITKCFPSNASGREGSSHGEWWFSFWSHFSPDPRSADFESVCIIPLKTNFWRVGCSHPPKLCSSVMVHDEINGQFDTEVDVSLVINEKCVHTLQQFRTGLPWSTGSNPEKDKEMMFNETVAKFSSVKVFLVMSRITILFVFTMYF